MSFWGKVFGTDEAIKGAVDAVRDGLDALVYTNEEKAVDAAKERSEARSMLVGWMEATQGQNLARRLISLAITGVWLFQYIVAQLAMSIAVFWTGKASELNELAKLNMASADDMGSAVMLILAFYFAAPHMGDFAQAIVGRFKTKTETTATRTETTT
jgi:hypothetical protein